MRSLRCARAKARVRIETCGFSIRYSAKNLSRPRESASSGLSRQLRESNGIRISSRGHPRKKRVSVRVSNAARMMDDKQRHGIPGVLPYPMRFVDFSRFGFVGALCPDGGLPVEE